MKYLLVKQVNFRRWCRNVLFFFLPETVTFKHFVTFFFLNVDFQLNEPWVRRSSGVSTERIKSANRFQNQPRTIKHFLIHFEIYSTAQRNIYAHQNSPQLLGTLPAHNFILFYVISTSMPRRISG